MRFFKPENDFEVKEALLRANRGDLIGNGCDSLIPANPSRETDGGHRENAEGGAKGDPHHTMANPAKGEPVGERGLPNPGYRPGRKTANRRQKRKRP